eukprot:gnl/TRDRNA2_/TRDRNA2_63908_c0_seq1.p1 gnl/TRDRNA2_/TRDRNA2_63908_c0~~gnl/TRDRNA2_/TRDRNA2_63908_c0_seq1.p1  ORF type:complete len:389 (+),score=31.77 gnl/TRDRNA2_/TRDRNA2_63908_c0_seq1:64-1230(+)
MLAILCVLGTLVAASVENTSELCYRDAAERCENGERDLFRTYMGQRCYMAPSGNEFDWSPKNMSFGDAHTLCARTDGCRGFTGKVGVSDLDPASNHSWQFLAKYSCFRHAEWVAFAMFKEDTDHGLDYDYDVPFVAPDLEVLRNLPNVTFLSDDPPILQFDGFLSDDEMDCFKRFAEPRLQASQIPANSWSFLRWWKKGFRTSSTAWIYLEDPRVRAVEARIAEITNVPRKNMEFPQVLRYDVGQQYRKHHDNAPLSYLQPCGPRVATFFMYLDDVEEGGETVFAHLGIEVKPAKGRAVLWWNMDHAALRKGADPMALARDPQLYHAGLPPKQGVKWAANYWLHPSDYRNNLGLRRLNSSGLTWRGRLWFDFKEWWRCTFAAGSPCPI